MKNYLALLQHILDEGHHKSDRTGSGTLSIFGTQLRFDLQAGFPLVTTKRVHWKSIVYELLWFLNGDTHIGYLQANQVSIWNAWATEDGDLGPVYGRQWRAWPTADGQTIDQLAKLVEQLRRTPDSRRLIVSAWNVADLPDESISPQANVQQGKMALAPCHAFFQFYVADGRLSCQIYQRSCDTFLGLPFNIASYALLTHILAQQCDLGVGELIWTGGDVHVYRNHVEQAQLQLQRTPYALPSLQLLRRPATLFDYRYEDFALSDYHAHPAIKAPISV
jgi:thymidylate synthase